MKIFPLFAIPLLVHGGGGSARWVDMRRTGLAGTLEAPEIGADAAGIPRNFIRHRAGEGRQVAASSAAPSRRAIATGTCGGTLRGRSMGLTMAKRQRHPRGRQTIIPGRNESGAVHQPA